MLPPTRQEKKLWEICSLQNWYAFKSKEYVKYGFFVMRIKNVQKWYVNLSDPQYIPLDRENEFKKFILEEWDILVSLTGNIWRVWLITPTQLPAVLNQRVGRIKLTDNNVDFSYLFHFLNSDLFENAMMVLGSWAAQKNISLSAISDFSIPLPPLDIQKSIVAKLDDAIQSIDQSLSILDGNLSKLDALWQSSLSESFDDPTRQEKPLWEVSEIIWGGTPKTWVSEYWENGDIFRTTPTDLWDIWEIIELTHTAKKITKLWLERSSAKLLPPWTVLFSSRASIGKIAISKEFISTNQWFASFVCWESLFNRYLTYCLVRFIPEITALSNSTTFKEVSKWSIKDFKIPLPPLDQQKVIVAHLDEVSKHISTSKQAYQNQKDHLLELKASILHDAFSGKLFT